MKPPVDAPRSRQSLPARVDAERVERVRELLAAARDESRRPLDGRPRRRRRPAGRACRSPGRAPRARALAPARGSRRARAPRAARRAACAWGQGSRSMIPPDAARRRPGDAATASARRRAGARVDREGCGVRPLVARSRQRQSSRRRLRAAATQSARRPRGRRGRRARPVLRGGRPRPRYAGIDIGLDPRVHGRGLGTDTVRASRGTSWRSAATTGW